MDSSVWAVIAPGSDGTTSYRSQNSQVVLREWKERSALAKKMNHLCEVNQSTTAGDLHPAWCLVQRAHTAPMGLHERLLKKKAREQTKSLGQESRAHL